MVVIQRIVGVMLPGAPSDGDPKGELNTRYGGPEVLTAVAAIVLKAQRVNTVAWIEAMVLTDHGTFKARFSEDQTKSAAWTWFTAPTIDI